MGGLCKGHVRRRQEGAAEKAFQKICFRKDVPAKAKQKECIKAGPFFVRSSESGLLPGGLRAGPGGLRALIFVCLSVCMGAPCQRQGLVTFGCLHHQPLVSAGFVRLVRQTRFVAAFLLLCHGRCEMAGRAQAALPGKQGAKHKCG